MQIKGKNVLLTGGAKGLGFAYAKELLRNGAAHVAILDFENSHGEGASERLNVEFGKGRAKFFACDVTKPQELEAGFRNIVEVFGSLDIVINNAALMDDDKWELMISVNVNAVVRGTLLGLQYMGKDKGGKGGVIVNVASILGVTPFPHCPIYVGTKHAVIGLSRSFAMPYHYEKTGVRILTLCPGVADDVGKNQGITNLQESSPDSINPINKLTSPKLEISVAHGMMFIIRSAQNGSVWIAEGAEPVYEILIPDCLTMKMAAKDMQ